MRVDVRNMLVRAAELVGTKPCGEEEQLVAGACRQALRTLAWDLDQLARGHLPLDRFCAHYCLEVEPAPGSASRRADG